MSLTIVKGSIIDSKEKYIVHQCNVVTSHSAGVAKLIFDAFPWSNIYKDRANRNVRLDKSDPEYPGNIVIKGNGQDQRYVINLMGQYYPGKPRFPDSQLDGYIARETHFRNALYKIAQIKDLESLALPWRISCNLAGGDWNHYLKMIENFSSYVPEIKVVIYDPN